MTKENVAFAVESHALQEVTVANLSCEIRGRI